MGLFSRSRLRGTQGAFLHTTVQVWVPGGLRGACSGRSKSRKLASIHGVAFRGAGAEQDNGKPTCQLFCSTAVKTLLCGSHVLQQQWHIQFVWTTTVHVWTLHMRVCVCYNTCVLLIGACGFACWKPTFQLLFFCSGCCGRIMSASPRPSSSQALYSLAATVQQQFHGKLV